MHRDDGITIYVLIDALGWELLRSRPFLDDILPERHRVETILGYSPGAIPTVLTGQLPNGHAHWNCFYRSPATSPFRWTRPLRWLPRSLREWRGTRRGIKEVAKRLSGYSGHFAIYNLPVDRLAYYDLCEKTDIYQPDGLAPATSIFDLFTARDLTYECYNYHTHTDQQILALIPQRLATSTCQIYFLYLSQLDTYLHFNIGNWQGVDKQLAFYEEGLRAVYRTAQQRWGRARLTIFSDHGMTSVQRIVDLVPEVERLNLRIPHDYLPAYDSTMARFWVESDKAERQLRNLLESLSYGRILSGQEMDRLGLTFDDGRYGHIVFLLEPGTLLCPSDMGRISFAGMHGYHPQEDPSSHAVFLSSEAPRTPIAHITGIFPNILADLEEP